MKRLPSLHLICSDDELRPVMCHVYINKEHAVATDSRALVRYDKALIDGLISGLPEEVYISVDEWKKLTRPYKFAEYRNGIIHVIDKKDGTFLVMTKEVDLVGRYPNYNAVIRENHENGEVGSIRVNADLLAKVQKAMNQEYVKDSDFGVNMHFEKDSSAILLTCLGNTPGILGLIMPRMIK